MSHPFLVVGAECQQVRRPSPRVVWIIRRAFDECLKTLEQLKQGPGPGARLLRVLGARPTSSAPRLSCGSKVILPHTQIDPGPRGVAEDPDSVQSTAILPRAARADV